MISWPHLSCLKHSNYLKETKNRMVMTKYYLEHKKVPSISCKGQTKIFEYAAFMQSLGNLLPLNKP